MRKGVLIIMTVLCLAGGAGCFGGKEKRDETDTTKEGNVEHSFVSEDFDRGNRTERLASMMRTDKGFYYYVYSDKGLHYYDMATGKNMFLCNKPECRHDGNEFCVATNQKYLTLNTCMYNDVILKYVAEQTDTKYSFKVLSVALDGSGMNEVATTLEFEKPTEGFAVYQCFMYVHRNKAFLTMAGAGQAEIEEYYGAAILDLNTKEVTYLDEEPFSSNNVLVQNVSAVGDYFYYCRKEGKKLLLHRYNITDGTEESFRLLPNFEGEYVVVDEDIIAYIKSSGTAICTYQISTGYNTEQTRMMRQFYEKVWLDGDYQKSGEMKESMVVQLETDGTYIYAAEPRREYVKDDENGERHVERREAYIHVLNMDLEEVALVELAEAASKIGYNDIDWAASCNTQWLRYMGEDIYWDFEPKGAVDSERYVFRCNREDFIAGAPEFEFVYRYNAY